MAWPLRDGSDCGSRASVSAIALAAAAACCGGSFERLCSMSGLEKADRPEQQLMAKRTFVKAARSEKCPNPDIGQLDL
jgi:hypothetical protein